MTPIGPSNFFGPAAKNARSYSKVGKVKLERTRADVCVHAELSGGLPEIGCYSRW